MSAIGRSSSLSNSPQIKAFRAFQNRVAREQVREQEKDLRRGQINLNQTLRSIIDTHPNIDIDRLPVQLAQIRLQYSGFLAFSLHEIIERVVVGEIKLQMRLQKVHEKIIQGTRISRVHVPRRGMIRYTIQSSYKAASGFNVAAMMEYGRQPYVVYPVRADMLHWRDKDTGEDVFAKESHIPPYPGKHIVSETVKRKRPVVQAELDERTEAWLRTILGV